MKRATLAVLSVWLLAMGAPGAFAFPALVPPPEPPPLSIVVAHPLDTLWRDLDESERFACGPDADMATQKHVYSSRRLVMALVRTHLLDFERSQDVLYTRQSFRDWLADVTSERMRQLQSGAYAPDSDRPDGVTDIARSLIQMLSLEHSATRGGSILSWGSPTGAMLELRRTDELIFNGQDRFEENFLSRGLNAPHEWARDVLADPGGHFRILARCGEASDFISAHDAPQQINGRFAKAIRAIDIGADENDAERPLSQRRGAGLSFTDNTQNGTQIWDWELGVSLTPWDISRSWGPHSPEQVNRAFFEHFAHTPDDVFRYSLSGTTLRPYFVLKRRAEVDTESDEVNVNVDFVSFGLQLSSFLERGVVRARAACSSPRPEGNKRHGSPCSEAGESPSAHGSIAYQTSRWRAALPISVEWVTDTAFQSSFARAQVRFRPSIGQLGDPRTAFPAPGVRHVPILNRLVSPYMQILASPMMDYAEVFEPGETLPLQEIERYFRVGGDFEFNVHFNSARNRHASRLRWFNTYRLRDDLSAGDRADAALFQSEINVLMPGNRFSLGLEYEEGEDERTLNRDERLQLVARYRL